MSNNKSSFARSFYDTKNFEEANATSSTKSVTPPSSTDANMARPSPGTATDLARPSKFEESEPKLVSTAFRHSKNSTDRLGDDRSTSTSSNNHEEKPAGWNDDDVFQQYRLMAQHEATLKVKQNIGFDVSKYEQRRQSKQLISSVENNLDRKTSNKWLPELRQRSNFSIKSPEPIEPEPLPFLPNRKFIEQPKARVPELCQGRAGSLSNIPVDEHAVRCIGCPEHLRVKRLASLVSCPNCNTVSPATSTRR